MKKIYILFFILFPFLITSCSKEDSRGEPDNPSVPEELSEYLVAPCDGTIEYLINDLLGLLRSEGYDTDNDGKISCTEADKVEHLNLGKNASIRSLDGIEYLRNLQTITGTLELKSTIYPYVTTLNLLNNKKLEEINFNVSEFGVRSSVGTVVLPNSNSLKIIDFSQTSIHGEILNIENKNKLKYVHISSGEPSILDLSESPNLEEVHVGNKVILGNHSLLETLVAPSVVDVDFSKIPNLETLRTTGGNLIDIDLSNNPKLQVLELPSSNLAQIDLTKNKQLTELNLNYNLISQLNFSENSELTFLSATNNGLISLDVSNSSKLTELYLTGNDLESINLNNNLALERVDLSKNKIKSLDFKAHKNLKYVDVSENDLTFLSLKNGNNSALSGGTVILPGGGTIIYSNVRANQNSLQCIEIDQGFTNYSRWIKDSFTEYSTQCD
jgi:hypothetical protein